MWRLSTLLVALLAYGAPRAYAAPTESDQVAVRLSELGAPDGFARLRAERWLSAHVGRGDVAELAEAVRTGDAEVRRRVSRVITAVDTDLWISTTFLGQTDERLQRVGERALRGRVALWSPEMAEPGLVGRELAIRVQATLERSWPEMILLRTDSTLDEACALLTRRGRLPLGLVVDPSIAERSLKAEPPAPFLIGTWDEIVGLLAARAGVGVEGYDMFFAPPIGGGGDWTRGAGPAAFLRFCPTEVAGAGEGVDMLVERCREVLDSTNASRRARAASALAESGWPAALAWLDARYRELGDEAALEGLLRAASTGRIAPALLRPDVLRVLIRAASERLGPGATRAASSHAYRIVDALRRLPPLFRDATPRAGAVLDGWKEADPAGRWVRLALLEGMSGGADMMATRDASAQVLASDAPPWLLHQALRAWFEATVGQSERTPPCVIANPAGVASPPSLVVALELARKLAFAGFVPPSAWSERSDPGAGLTPLGRVTLFAWWINRGDAKPAAVLWATQGGQTAASPAWDAALVELVPLHRSTLHSAWEAARAADATTRDRVDRSAIGAGLVGSEHGESIALALFPEPARIGQASPAVVEMLGAVAGWGVGVASEQARTLLAARLALALADPESAAARGEEAQALVTALVRSTHDLAAGEFLRPVSSIQFPGRATTHAEAWRAEIQSLLRRHARSALRAALSGAWPPNSVRPVDLEMSDRRP